jgi:hypothetical protein
MNRSKLAMSISVRSPQPDNTEAHEYHRHASPVDSLQISLLQLAPKVNRVRDALRNRGPGPVTLQLPKPYQSLRQRLLAVPTSERTVTQMLALYLGAPPIPTAAQCTQRALQAPAQKNEAQSLGRFFIDALSTVTLGDRQLMRRYKTIAERCNVVDRSVRQWPHDDPAEHRRTLLLVFAGLQRELERDLGRLQAAMQATQSVKDLFAYTPDRQKVLEGDALVAVYLATPLPLSVENIFPGHRRQITVTNYSEYFLTVRAYSHYVDTLVRLQSANQVVRQAVRDSYELLARTLA